MIEAGKVLKELADQNSDLGKLAKQEASSFGKESPQMYDVSLASPDGMKSNDSEAGKRWYEDLDKKADNDDDLLGVHKQQDSADNSESPQEIHQESLNESNESMKDVEDIGKEGGRYQDLKDEGWGWNTNPPTEVHHMPADASSDLERSDGPAIVMDYYDHRETASCGNSREAQEYRAKQKELIDEGKFREAFQMDVDDIHEKFGNKYDEAISKAQDYIDQLEKENKI